MLNGLLYEHLEKHWISECSLSFHQSAECLLSAMHFGCIQSVEFPASVGMFFLHLGEAYERIQAICRQNKVRETKGKTDGGQIWEWSFAPGSLEVQHGHRKHCVNDFFPWKLPHAILRCHCCPTRNLTVQYEILGFGIFWIRCVRFVYGHLLRACFVTRWMHLRSAKKRGCVPNVRCKSRHDLEIQGRFAGILGWTCWCHG